MVKYPWDDEPTPLCDRDLRANGVYAQCSPSTLEKFMPPDVPRDLERRLRRALKLVNSLRIDCMHGELDHEMEERRLSDIEEILTP